MPKHRILLSVVCPLTVSVIWVSLAPLPSLAQSQRERQRDQLHRLVEHLRLYASEHEAGAPDTLAELAAGRPLEADLLQLLRAGAVRYERDPSSSSRYYSFDLCVGDQCISLSVIACP